MGFARVETIDEDLGRSGSGLRARPGFERLVASVCSGAVGAVMCIEASRLARNGRDWHHLIDLCALAGTLVIDPDGIYDPRLMNDRLLLGLKGTMSEYELSLLRQRGLAARDSKAGRGELRFNLPPGYCWDELGRICKEPDTRVRETIATIFSKFSELGSARQVLMWSRTHGIQIPVLQPGARGAHLEWRVPAYHNILLLIRNPLYAGAYVFGRTESRTRVEDGRGRKTSGHKKSRDRWSVLLRDHHEGFITWAEYEHNQVMLDENAHVQHRASKKSGRGGRALLTGLLRCGRCGRMLRVLYGARSGHAHRYQCVGEQMKAGTAQCLGIGGVRVDAMLCEQLVTAVNPHAVGAAIAAADRAESLDREVCQALQREIEAARYEADLAARRHSAVDPAKRLVAAELEERWERELARARELEQRLEAKTNASKSAVPVDRGRLLALAHDLPSVWNAPDADARLKQRIVRVLVQEVVVDEDRESQEVVLAIHWVGGRHSTARLKRVRSRHGGSAAPRPNAVEAIRKLGGKWPDRELAVTMNRLGCRAEGGATWTAARILELRDRLGVPKFDPLAPRAETVSMDQAAVRLSICVPSVRRLIRAGVLPATQEFPAAPWEIPVTALESDAVRIGARDITARRPRNLKRKQGFGTPMLPGMGPGEAE
jgi:DNA invertase Pin-like site-specific DNA recombinase